VVTFRPTQHIFFQARHLNMARIYFEKRQREEEQKASPCRGIFSYRWIGRFPYRALTGARLNQDQILRLFNDFYNFHWIINLDVTASGPKLVVFS